MIYCHCKMESLHFLTKSCHLSIQSIALNLYLKTIQTSLPMNCQTFLNKFSRKTTSTKRVQVLHLVLEVTARVGCAVGRLIYSRTSLKQWQFKILMKESFLILFFLHQDTLQTLVNYFVKKTSFALFKTSLQKLLFSNSYLILVSRVAVVERVKCVLFVQSQVRSKGKSRKEAIAERGGREVRKLNLF